MRLDDMASGPDRASSAARRTLSDSYLKRDNPPRIERSDEDDDKRTEEVNRILKALKHRA